MHIKLCNAFIKRVSPSIHFFALLSCTDEWMFSAYDNDVMHLRIMAQRRVQPYRLPTASAQIHQQTTTTKMHFGIIAVSAGRHK